MSMICDNVMGISRQGKCHPALHTFTRLLLTKKLPAAQLQHGWVKNHILNHAAISIKFYFLSIYI